MGYREIGEYVDWRSEERKANGKKKKELRKKKKIKDEVRRIKGNRDIWK